jgi:hypothetical protein
VITVYISYIRTIRSNAQGSQEVTREEVADQGE